MNIPTREKIRRAVQELEGKRANGVSSEDIYDYLNREYPRSDGRPWKGNMAIPGDYAVWEKSGEPTNPSAANDPAFPKFLVRVSALGERPARYRMRPAE
ncbi:hypothetical protein D3C87_1428170 [compost metagenome]